MSRPPTAWDFWADVVWPLLISIAAAWLGASWILG
jgi:hypothetical protein